jgi:hypothetical protein
VGQVINNLLGKNQTNVANQSLYQSNTVFGEQQGFEKQLQQLISDPSSVTKLPGYQFNLQQGEQAVARQFGPTAGSGAEGIALTQYGANYANNAYATQVGVLSNLAGITSPVNPTSANSVAATGYADATKALDQIIAAMTFAAGAGTGGGGGGGGGGPSALAGMTQGGYLLS